MERPKQTMPLRRCAIPFLRTRRSSNGAHDSRCNSSTRANQATRVYTRHVDFLAGHLACNLIQKLDRRGLGELRDQPVVVRSMSIAVFRDPFLYGVADGDPVLMRMKDVCDLLRVAGLAFVFLPGPDEGQ